MASEHDSKWLGIDCLYKGEKYVEFVHDQTFSEFWGHVGATVGCIVGGYGGSLLGPVGTIAGATGGATYGQEKLAFFNTYPCCGKGKNSKGCKKKYKCCGRISRIDDNLEPPINTNTCDLFCTFCDKKYGPSPCKNIVYFDVIFLLFFMSANHNVEKMLKKGSKTNYGHGHDVELVEKTDD